MSLSVKGSVENALVGASPETKAIFEKLKEMIISFGPDIKERATKYEIRYQAEKVFVSMRVNRKNIKAWIRVNPEKFSDPKGIVRTMKWSPPHFFYINSMEEADYAISLIKQAYDFCKKQEVV